ncbi:DUF835 domain-containing protein [bacterium]|nr:DUF835 domain-containing protein [candidate division CSSED10-310 bacterium]
MNYWAFFSLVPGLIHCLLGAYIYFLKPRSLLSRIFTLFTLSLAVWCLTEFGHRLTSSPKIAFLLIRAGGFGWCFMQSLCTHFILVFARQKKILAKKLTYIILYGPSTILLVLFLFTNLIYYQEPYKMFYGYTSLPGKLVGIYASYYLFLYLCVMYFLVQVIRKNILVEKKQARPLLFGSAFFLLLATMSNVVLPDPKNSTPEIGTTLSIVWAVSVFYAVLKHKLFIITPTIENVSITPEKYTLHRGRCYYVKEVKPEKGFEIFRDQITHNRPGFCITKLIPEKVRERYKLIKTPILRLTFHEGKGTISPKDLDGFMTAVSNFLRQTKNSLLFIDCLDQIKVANGMKKTLDLIADFNKLCFETNMIILVSINPGLFSKQQLSNLENEMIRAGNP